MKKIICILAVFLGILGISSVAFASDFVAVSSSKFEFTGVPNGIAIKKSDNRNSEITNLIAEAKSEHDNAMIFDLQAYEGENEIQLSDTEIGVNISNSGMSSGYYGYGKDYRIFKIDNKTLTPIECIESKNNVTFTIMNVGTYAFVYNTKENGSFKSSPAACTVIPSFPATEPITSAVTRTFTTFSLTYLLNLLI